jgi:RecA/RadA recombinase
MSVSLEEALAQLDPKLRKKLGTGVGVNYEYQPTPSYGLNRALGGGLPYGRQVLIWGSKSSAKSSMCLQMIALAQAELKTRIRAGAAAMDAVCKVPSDAIAILNEAATKGAKK